MRIPVIDRLKQAALDCRDVFGVAEIHGQLAYHLGRVGEFSIAREMILSVRSDPAARSNTKAAIWVMLADGVVDYFERLEMGSIDRFERAFAVSGAVGDLELSALSAAWIAHLKFVCSDFDAMVIYINKCCQVILPEHEHAVARLSLVLANSFLILGDTKSSRKWFDSAHRAALSEGDRATVGALLYNRSALMLARYRAALASGTDKIFEIVEIRTAVQSAVNFQKHTKNLALNDLLIICEARLASIERQFSVAIELLDNLRCGLGVRFSGAKKCMLDVEYAVCLIGVGDLARAREVIGFIDGADAADMEIDDRLVFYAEISGICDILSVRCPVLDVGRKLAESLVAFKEHEIRLGLALRGVLFGRADNLT